MLSAGRPQDASERLHARKRVGTALDDLRFHTPWAMGIHSTGQIVQQELVVHKSCVECVWPRAPQPYPHQRQCSVVMHRKEN